MKQHKIPPTKIMMEKTVDPDVWEIIKTQLRGPDREAYDKIASFPGFHRDSLGILPGISLKAVLTQKGWAHTGVLARYGHTGVQTGMIRGDIIVLDNDTRTIWHGTPEEYYEMWCVD